MIEGPFTYQQLLLGLGISLVVLFLLYLLPTGKKSEAKKEEKSEPKKEEPAKVESKPEKKDADVSDARFNQIDARLKNLEYKKQEDIRLGNIENRLSAIENGSGLEEKWDMLCKRLDNIEARQYNGEPVHVIVEKQNNQQPYGVVPKNQVKVYSTTQNPQSMPQAKQSVNNDNSGNYLYERFNNTSKIKPLEKPTVLKNETSNAVEKFDNNSNKFVSEFNGLSKQSKVAIVSNVFDRR